MTTDPNNELALQVARLRATMEAQHAHNRELLGRIEAKLDSQTKEAKDTREKQAATIQNLDDRLHSVETELKVHKTVILPIFGVVTAALSTGIQKLLGI